MEAYQGIGESLVWGKGKGRKGKCEEKISSYVWKGVHEKTHVCKK